MKITTQIKGEIDNNSKEVVYITIENSAGASVVLSNMGAGLVSIFVPDKEGVLDDVLLGYQDYRDFYKDGFGMGKTIGRYANRIGQARYTYQGKSYELVKNSGENHIHGGTIGLANRIWDFTETKDGVIFSYVSPDGEDGYCHTINVETHYKWTEENILNIEYRAFSDGPTIINLTNHSYFNLSGDQNSLVLDHELRLNSSEYVVTDENLIPTGMLAPVFDSPMNFRTKKEIGRDIHRDFAALNIGEGYDSCWVVARESGKNELTEAAYLKDPLSSRVLRIYTTQPGVQIYTGNHLEGAATGKGGVRYRNFSGVAIECQGYPDSPNHLNFPSQILDKGDVYKQIIIFSFEID